LWLSLGAGQERPPLQYLSQSLHADLVPVLAHLSCAAWQSPFSSQANVLCEKNTQNKLHIITAKINFFIIIFPFNLTLNYRNQKHLFSLVFTFTYILHIFRFKYKYKLFF
jgi:hypothetical protein